MSKNYANVEVATDTFNSWVNRTNDIVTTLRNEILTANNTSATPGTTTGNAELIGTFSANTIKATVIQGGNVSTNTAVSVYGNVSILSNSSNYSALRVTGGSAVGTGLYANADEYILAGNASGTSSFNVRSNTSWTAIRTTGNTSFTNVSINATSAYISANNIALSGDSHTVTGNVSFDSGVLFVDQTNNRVGVNNTTPDASLSVTGTANVSGNTRVGGVLTVGANASVTGNLSVTGAASLSNTLNVTGLATLDGSLNTITANASAGVNVGANVKLITTRITVGDGTINTYITNTTIETDGTLVVAGLATTGNLNTATANASSAVNAGANNTLNTTALRLGIGATNTVITSSNVYTGGALTVVGLANTGDLNTGVANATSVNVGANVNLTTTQINVGNGAGNSIVSATGISTNGTLSVSGLATVGNLNTSTANATIINVGADVSVNTTVIRVGSTQSNTTTVFSNNLLTETANASSGINVGANNTLNTTALRLGIGTTNTIITSSNVYTGGALTVVGLANTGNLNTATANASTAVNVGANVNLTTTRITIGSATVNTFITNTTIETDGTLVVADLASLNGGLNTTTANATTAVNVGANINLSTTRLAVGNATVNTVITSTSIDTDGTLAVLGAATLSNTIGVTGAATFSNTVGVTGKLSGSEISANAFTMSSNTVAHLFTSNADIGSDTGNPTLIYSFPAASYSSGKLLVQVKNTGNTQISEMLIAHDGTTSILTAFGTVNSPAGSDLGDFSTSIVSTNVEVYLLQTSANSSVTVSAQLIK